MNGADRLEDLVTWQLIHELNLEIIAFTRHPPAGHDFKFRDQLRDAADSAERNVAEGFGRYNPTEFARFLDFSRGSALETRGLLQRALASGYLPEREFRRLDRLVTRTLQVLARFQRYLRSSAARRNAARYRYTKRHRNVPNDPNDSNDPNVSNDPNDPTDPNE